MRAVGIRNLVWRTPGPDGGRDIEGKVFVRDVSGYEEEQCWYVECKQYSRSVPWNVIWNKLSFADSMGADVLLVATNSTPSPQAETHISYWNDQKRKPSIRVWRGYDFPALLRSRSSIAASFGLIDEPLEKSSVLKSLSNIIVNITQSAYAARVFENDPLCALETASALSELLVHRLGDLDQFGKFRYSAPKQPNLSNFLGLQSMEVRLNGKK